MRVNPNSPAVRADLESLHAECFDSQPGDLFKTGYWWIGYRGQEAVAFCSIRQSYWWANVGYLSRAGVAESARGQHLQRRLIAVRLALARRLGYVAVITDTCQNPASSNNLTDAGFRMYLPAQPWSYKTAVYYRKKLA